MAVTGEKTNLLHRSFLVPFLLFHLMAVMEGNLQSNALQIYSVAQKGVGVELLLVGEWIVLPFEQELGYGRGGCTEYLDSASRKGL